MDFEPAEPASPRDSMITRRTVLGAAGFAGIVGSAAAVLGGTTAFAAPEPAPNQPTDSDIAALTAALTVELAAVELYRIAADALPFDVAEIAVVMANQHRAYTNALSGMLGIPDPEPSAVVLDLFSDAFATPDPQAFGAVASTLENTAVVTHSELLGSYDSVHAIGLTASIIPIEARHATVLTSLAGFASDLDAMLGTDAQPLQLSGGAA